MKFKNKNYPRTMDQARHQLHQNTLHINKHHYDIEFTGSPEVCKEYDAEVTDNNTCTRKFIYPPNDL